jgi:serine/threonine protein kinase
MLGPYTLIRRLGAGGMGEVWTARRSALGGAAKLAAIKILLPEKASDQNARKMFLEEARLSMLLTNSNIVQVFDVGEGSDGTCYMAMELVDGIDLAQLTEHLNAAGEQLSLSAVAYIVGEILKALAYAHEFNHEGKRRTLVHRDVSPHNVMLSVSGEVKLMDFGVARFASEDTSGMFVKGKVRYMPPEQFDGETRDPTIDLFPVGAILHELLDGKKFRGGPADEARLLGMCIKGEVLPLSCPPQRVPPQLEQLRQGLLAPAAKDRIPTARAAHRLLSQWPGDRDAKFELEEIVQRVVNATLSRAVVWGALTTIDVQPKPNQAEIPASDGSDTDVARRPASDRTGGRREHEGSNSATAVSMALVRPSHRLARRSVGLSLAVVGTGTVLGWWTDEGTSEAPLVAEAELAAGQPAQDIAQPHREIESAQPRVEIAEPPAAAREPESRAPPPEPEISRTSVTISADAVWSQVKIAGKTYTLDRLKGSKKRSAKLEPGKYTVAFRDDPEASWQSLGQVTIPESGRVKLEIKGGVADIRK